MISGLSSNSEFLHFKLFIERSLNAINSPFFNFTKVFFELILSKIFISINCPFKLSRAFTDNEIFIKKNRIKLI